VVVGTPNALYPLSGESGSPLFGTNGSNPYASVNPGCRVFNTPAVADVYEHGEELGWRLFEACGGPAAFSRPGEVASFRLAVQPVTAPWPMFHASPPHTGVEVTTTPTTPTGAGL
jgi:hypothetical protein